MHDTMYLFGGDQEWRADDWETTDDRVRGGSSTSHLTIRRSPHGGHDETTACFHGHLDTSTLGGAGFASQQTRGTNHWDLSGHDGLRLQLASGSDHNGGDGKKYVLTLKDDIPGRRHDGRMKSGLSYEAEFRAEGSGSIWLPWKAFRATYRGRPRDDAEPLDLKNVKRVGLMMRSFFDQQDGDFSLELRSIAAVREGSSQATSTDSASRDSEDDYDSLKKPSQDGQSGPQSGNRAPAQHGWRRMFCGLL